MTEISLPWQGTAVGDAGAYSHTQWAQAWSAMLHGYSAVSAYADRGPIRDTGTPPVHSLFVQPTTPASAAVEILAGAALVDGTFYLNDAAVQLTIAANASGNPRIDIIVLQKNFATQTIRLAVHQGTPAASPVPPSLTQVAGVTWEVPLAHIAVANGFASILLADISPRHDWVNPADSVYLEVLNDSGGDLETGDVVVWDSATPGAVTTTTTINHPFPAGVWVGYTPNGEYGRVLNQGIGLVKMTGAASAGSAIQTSATLGQARSPGSTTRQNANLGHLLQASSAAGIPTLAFIDAQRLIDEKALYSYVEPTNTTGPQFTTGADRTVPLNTEDYDPGAIGALSGNQVTVGPGTYRVKANLSVRIPTGGGSFRLKIWNATGGSELATGENVTGGSNTDAVVLTVDGVFTLTVTTALEVRVRVTVNSFASFALNIVGQTERYATFLIEKH